MFSGLGLRRVLVGAVLLIGVAHAASGGGSASRLRARQSQQQQQQQQAQNDNSKDSGLQAVGGGLELEHGRRLSGGGGSGVLAAPVEGHRGMTHRERSLKSTRDPQCNLPEAFPCTLNTTAIGMVERGYATYYDDTCEATLDLGCYTDGVPACRTCYLSTEIYMAATNATDQSRPKWAMCPCCVPTTLDETQFDIDLELKAFDYSVFNISESACTDAPTPAPAPTDAVTAPTAPTPVAPATPEPELAAPTATPRVEGVDATSAPEAASRTLGSPAPTGSMTTATSPAPTAAATDADADGAAADTDTENLDTSGGDDGLSLGAKVGIGAGAAVGVIILGAAGLGIMKATGGRS